MRILLIEDDLNFCETLRFQLEQEAYEVDVCHDGRDGLDLFLQDAHDIVLLDRMLPTMNGLLVLQKARQAGISTPVILITALGELYDRIEGLDAGADDYIVKPFAFEELTARIRSLGRRSGKWEDDNLLTICDISYRLFSVIRSRKNAASTTTGIDTFKGDQPIARAMERAPKDTWESPSPIME